MKFRNVLIGTLTALVCGGLAVAQISPGGITAAQIIAALGYTPATNVLTSAHVFVGNGSNVATDVALSGDVSIDNTGASTVGKVNGTTYPASPGTVGMLPVVTATASGGTVTYQTPTTSGVQTNQNIVQNGDMAVDQPNEGAAKTITTGSGNLRIPDRWTGLFVTSTSSAGNPSIQQQAASSGLTGFAKSILITVSGTPSTTTPTALIFNLRHIVEAADMADLAYGTTGAQVTTLSMYLKSSVSNAIITGSFLNSGVNRTFLWACPALTANTWTRCSIAVPGDTTGTWLTAAGSTGVAFRIGLSAGSTFTGTVTGGWQTATGGQPSIGSTQTNLTDTANATLEITGIKWERGSTATPYWSVPYAQNILTLKRYYWKTFAAGTAPAQNVASVVGAITVKNPVALGDPSIWVSFNPPMYAAPTVTTFNPSAGNANWRDVTAGADATVSVDAASSLGTTGVNIATSGTVATLGDYLAIHATFDAGL